MYRWEIKEALLREAKEILKEALGEDIDAEKLYTEIARVITNNKKYESQIWNLDLSYKFYEITIDYLDFALVYKAEFSTFLINTPEVIIRMIQHIVGSLLYEMKGVDIHPNAFHISIKGEAGIETDFKELINNPSKYLWKFVTVEGIVTRVYESIGRRFTATFECRNCGYRVTETSPFGKLTVDTPMWCPEEGAPRKFEYIPKESISRKMMRFYLQPLDPNPGQTPQLLEAVVEEPILDKVKAGMRVRINGILMQEDYKRRGVNYLREFLYVINLEPIKDDIELHLTNEDIKLIRQEAEKPDFYEKILRSLAPHIYGMDDIKEALLLATMQAPERNIDKGIKKRHVIHILLVGDPGLGKSDLLKWFASVSPKGMYTSGKGISAAGLTAAVIKEKDAGFVLEPGVVVLCDGDICCIDEFDKAKPEDRTALHTAMEQMIVPVSKANFHVTFNARTSILAAANPKLGKYIDTATFMDNVNLPSTLINRFDVIYLVRDEMVEGYEDEITTHVAETWGVEDEDEMLSRLAAGIEGGGEGKRREKYTQVDREDIYPSEFITKYILYARTINPKLSRKAVEKLTRFYKQIKSQGDELSIPITTRQYESLIRLTLASARAHLRNIATEEDADIAIKHITNMLNLIAKDEEGKINILIPTANVTTSKSKTQLILMILKDLSKDYPDGVPEVVLIETIKDKTPIKDEMEIRQFITRLLTFNIIYEVRPGHYQPID